MLQVIAFGVTAFTAIVGAASVINAVRVKETQDADRSRAPAPPVSRPPPEPARPAA